MLDFTNHIRVLCDSFYHIRGVMMNKNVRKTAGICVFVCAAMLGLAYLFVPLYNLFCKVTGFDGTTQVATQAPMEIIDRKIEVIFTSTIDPKLPWEFKPLQNSMTLRVGEVGLAFFKVKNLSDKPITGMALYNVSPNKMGAYFTKIQCFCFNQQTLLPHQEMDMPVTFFIDPKMDKEKSLDEISQVVLSYTFELYEERK